MTNDMTTEGDYDVVLLEGGDIVDRTRLRASVQAHLYAPHAGVFALGLTRAGEDKVLWEQAPCPMAPGEVLEVNVNARKAIVEAQ